MAQGVGPSEGPLDSRRERLIDPATIPEAKALGDQLRTLADEGKPINLVPMGGLEIPFKRLIRRVPPAANVAYQTSSDGTGLDLPLFHERLRITRLFKALQSIEGQRLHKLFPEYVVFDTETTDIDIDRCEVIELAAVRVLNGAVVEEFHTLVHVNQPIAAKASEVHGYTAADLVGQPTLEEVWPRFLAFVGERMLVVHNGHRFDVPLLKVATAQRKRHGGAGRLRQFAAGSHCSRGMAQPGTTGQPLRHRHRPEPPRPGNRLARPGRRPPEVCRRTPDTGG